MYKVISYHIAGRGGGVGEPSETSVSEPSETNEAEEKGNNDKQSKTLATADDGIDKAALGAMVRNLEKWCPEHQPLWTCVGVAALAEGGMGVEIDVIADVGVGVGEESV